MKGVVKIGAYVVKKDKSGSYMFGLKAGNGSIIALSESYSSKNACEDGIKSVRNNSIAAVLEDQTVRGFTTERNPKFELFKDKAGEFRFHLKAANGEIILKSEGYTVKASCKNGIASVVKNAPDSDVVSGD